MEWGAKAFPPLDSPRVFRSVALPGCVPSFVATGLAGAGSHTVSVANLLDPCVAPAPVTAGLAGAGSPTVSMANLFYSGVIDHAARVGSERGASGGGT